MVRSHIGFRTLAADATKSALKAKIRHSKQSRCCPSLSPRRFRQSVEVVELMLGLDEAVK